MFALWAITNRSRKGVRMSIKKSIPAIAKGYVAAGFIGLVVLLGVALFHFKAQRAAMEAILETVPGGVAVLDDCDPDYDGKSAYEDNLIFMNAAGKITARLSNLNICQEIGCPNRMAVDHERNRIWVSETVTGRLLLFNLDGRQLLSISENPSSTLAVDPETGNVWAAIGGTIGKGSIAVYDDKGTCLATYDAHGYDITYDPVGEAFWLVDSHITKVAKDGTVLMQKPVTGWCGVSVAVSEKSGMVWVAARRHPDRGGANELICLDNNGNQQHKIDFGNRVPFRVVMDTLSDAVYVVLKGHVIARYSSAGKLEKEYKLPAVSAAIERATGNIWVMTYKEILKINPDGDKLCRTRNQCRDVYGWLAAY